MLADTLPQPAIYSEFAAAGESLAAAYESRDTASVVREIMALADRANQYIDQRKPWILAKSPEKSAEVQGICTLGLNMFRALMIYLQPILPDMATKSMRFFNETRWVWDTAAKPLLGARIAPYEVLATRLDPVAVAQLVEPESAAAAAGKPATAAEHATVAHATPAPTAMIAIEDFARVDLRVAKVLAVDLIDGADKLLKLRIDVGELGMRQILAGIRAAYDPLGLVGRLIVVVANLEPRKMRFGISEGMMLAAGPGGKDIFLLSPDSGALPGMRIK